MPRLYIETLPEDGGLPRLVQAPSEIVAGAEVDALSAKRGTSEAFELQFLNAGVPTRRDIAAKIRFTLKEVTKYDGAAIVFSGDTVAGDTWIRPGEETGFYLASPSFNTTELNALLFSPDGNSANDLASVTLMGEFSWRIGTANPTKTKTFDCVVDNAVDNGAEAAPTDAVAIGVATIRHADGTTTTYRATADSDTARGAALQSAFTASAAGDVILLGPGTYGIAASLNFSAKPSIHIKGSGKLVTTIRATANFAPMIYASTEMSIEDLTLDGGGQTNAYGLGMDGSLVTTPMTLRVASVRFKGNHDCLLLGAPTGSDIRFNDCEFLTTVQTAIGVSDAMVLTGPGEFNNCLFFSDGANIGAVRAVNIYGAARFRGCQFKTARGTGTDATLNVLLGADLEIDGGEILGTGVIVSGGTARLRNVRIDTAASAATNPITKSGGSLILGAGTVLVAHSTRDSIEAATPQDVSIYPGCCTNRPMDVNVNPVVSDFTYDTEVA